ncbi:hypothetical protein GCM10007898_22260 [Dyella flagellata]|uniref:Uncharacterized protein n=3 Tax=Dyella flagellata TaxID=1867833 RepID=A0ABQ5XDE1_9GAMM|nr:hypothetical protein GCM10007898_22260 [Dyella flagellata]
MAMNFRYCTLAGLVLMGMTSVAMAASDDNKTVASAGVQQGTGYFRLVEPTSVSCLYSVIYIPNLSTDAGQRAMYATVLAAESSSRKIAHLSYDVDSMGRCNASLVEIAP